MSLSKLSKTPRLEMYIQPQFLQLRVATKGMSLSSHYCLHIDQNITIMYLIDMHYVILAKQNPTKTCRYKDAFLKFALINPCYRIPLLK
jgi:hypothetical protein